MTIGDTHQEKNIRILPNTNKKKEDNMITHTSLLNTISTIFVLNH